MPAELLLFPPTYCVVGAYRLFTDAKLWHPIWIRSRLTLFRCLLAALPYALLAYPVNRFFVTLFLSRSPISPAKVHDAAYFGINVVNFATLASVLGQMSYGLEWLLSRQVRKSRQEVYELTVQSRGKGPEFWQPYVEEWAEPPLDRAKRSFEKQSFFASLASPYIKRMIMNILLAPLSFIPFLGLIVLAALNSLTMARVLHAPFFKAKKMTPLQIELFIVERQFEYRSFGFVASALERIPVFGILFNISNRIGAAMWAHDLEKEQHAYASGEIPKTKVYSSKTAALPASILPPSFVGGFPTKKGPVRIERDGSEVGVPSSKED